MSTPAIPEQRVYLTQDLVPPTTPEPTSTNYLETVPIAIDLGKSAMRIGLTNSTSPSHVFPSIVSRFRERKSNRNLTLVGNDVYLESSANSKSLLKTPFDGNLITNWDCVENLMDYSFTKLGVSSQGGVNNPVIITEILGAPSSHRANMYQLLFEAYNAPKVVAGIDSLFSYHANNGKDGLVIGVGHEATHVYPVIGSKLILSESKRLDYGMNPAVSYLQRSLALKYPYFPTRLNQFQLENMFKDHCYVSANYREEVASILEMDNLVTKDRCLQVPFVEVVKQVKTEEELALEAEKRRESGRRLQEQAQKKRLEKLIQKEQEFEYYTKLQNEIANTSKKHILTTIINAGFEDEQDFKKYVNNLEKSLKRARNQDIGDDEHIEEPSFPLVDIPDEDLDEEQIKEKRKQRLMKANHDARKRAKMEKEQEKLRKELEIQRDQQWRDSDRQAWINDRREKLQVILDRRKERKKLKDELNDRKSHAAQLRMKNIASLAAGDERKAGSERRRRTGNSATIDNDPSDTFGANDDDWAIYRDIANVQDSELEEEEEKTLVQLEQDLLEHDPNFTIEDTYANQFDYKKSIIHKFLHGPTPFDPEDQRSQHQIHLNVERIKIPEILFQPSIAGIDQAGLLELGEDILTKRLSGACFSGDSYSALQDIFITGGGANLAGFKSRIVNEFTSFLPTQSPLNVRVAEDPVLDAWRGMAKWSNSDECSKSYITKLEYQEMGPDYIKEHNLGNISTFI